MTLRLLSIYYEWKFILLDHKEKCIYEDLNATWVYLLWWSRNEDFIMFFCKFCTWLRKNLGFNWKSHLFSVTIANRDNQRHAVQPDLEFICISFIWTVLQYVLFVVCSFVLFYVCNDKMLVSGHVTVWYAVIYISVFSRFRFLSSLSPSIFRQWAIRKSTLTNGKLKMGIAFMPIVEIF